MAARGRPLHFFSRVTRVSDYTLNSSVKLSREEKRREKRRRSEGTLKIDGRDRWTAEYERSRKTRIIFRNVFRSRKQTLALVEHYESHARTRIGLDANRINNVRLTIRLLASFRRMIIGDGRRGREKGKIHRYRLLKPSNNSVKRSLIDRKRCVASVHASVTKRASR